MKDYLKEIEDLSYDVNPKEIASHIEDDSLGNWCTAFRTTLKYLINAVRKQDDSEIEQDVFHKYPLGSKWVYRDSDYIIPVKVIEHRICLWDKGKLYRAITTEYCGDDDYYQYLRICVEKDFEKHLVKK